MRRLLGALALSTLTACAGSGQTAAVPGSAAASDTDALIYPTGDEYVVYSVQTFVVAVDGRAVEHGRFNRKPVRVPSGTHTVRVRYDNTDIYGEADVVVDLAPGGSYQAAGSLPDVCHALLCIADRQSGVYVTLQQVAVMRPLSAFASFGMAFNTCS